jgi:hypothetical protein
MLVVERDDLDVYYGDLDLSRIALRNAGVARRVRDLQLADRERVRVMDR